MTIISETGGPEGPDLFNTLHHAEALELMVAKYLATKQGKKAYWFADRACRSLGLTARRLIHRSMSLRLLGESQAALLDLRTAQSLHASDMHVARLMLAFGVERTERLDAAHVLLDNPRCSTEYQAAAFQCLKDYGETVAIGSSRLGRDMRGWVSWYGSAEVYVEWTSESRAGTIGVTQRETFSDGRRMGTFRFDSDPTETLALSARTKSDVSTQHHAYALQPPPWNASLWRERRSGNVLLNVIIPVYKDYDVTKLCLASLAAQQTSCKARIIIINDNSPDDRLSSLAREECAKLGALYIHNSINIGFSGSVNKAILKCDPGDVLLLNSDVILPSDALERLTQAAHSANNIGTVTPLSNDSAATSFPIPQFGNPLLSDIERQIVDDAAQSANTHSIVDVMSNIGFCLYVRQACLADTGLLNTIYGRGYYEDVELCLRAAERGFRNVAAVGLYVSHASSRSFGAAKAKLVTRNASLIDTRFPGFEPKYQVALTADALKESRSAIEALLPPKTPVLLILGRPAISGPIMTQRAGFAAATGALALWLTWSQMNEEITVHLQACEEALPRSLFFVLDAKGSKAFDRYLAALVIRDVEFCEIAQIPSMLLARLVISELPLSIVVSSRDTAVALLRYYVAPSPPEAGFRIVFQRRSIESIAPEQDLPIDYIARHKTSLFGIAADAMAAAFLARADGLPNADAPKQSCLTPQHKALATVACLVPVPTVSVDKLIAMLGRALRGRCPTTLVVFGTCVNDLGLMRGGNIFVTGPIAAQDYQKAFVLYDIDGIFFPYRTSFFGLLRDASVDVSKPRAYFDWSDGALLREPTDLVLDWDSADSVVATAFLAWCMGVAAFDPSPPLFR